MPEGNLRHSMNRYFALLANRDPLKEVLVVAENILRKR
jgi:hypothetical protein